MRFYHDWGKKRYDFESRLDFERRQNFEGRQDWEICLERGRQIYYGNFVTLVWRGDRKFTIVTLVLWFGEGTGF